MFSDEAHVFDRAKVGCKHNHRDLLLQLNREIRQRMHLRLQQAQVEELRCIVRTGKSKGYMENEYDMASIIL